MSPTEQRRNIWTLIAFLSGIAFVFHIMVIPVFFGFHAMLLFETDRSVTAAIPKWFPISAGSTLALCVLFWALSTAMNRRTRIRTLAR